MRLFLRIKEIKRYAYTFVRGSHLLPEQLLTFEVTNDDCSRDKTLKPQTKARALRCSSIYPLWTNYIQND